MSVAGVMYLLRAGAGEFDPARPAVTLYVGADAGTVQGRRFALAGPRMFNGSYGPNSKFAPDEVPAIDGWCDSGAFNDAPEDRLTPDAALARQLAWERKASAKWGTEYRHTAVVSYDLLIDEKWVGGRRKKERWTVAEADRAVRVTVDAAAYLAAQRDRLAPRRLVLACQGVDAIQYAECAAGVLPHCRPGDVFGLGGWCILGWFKSWIPTFWAAARRVLPAVAAAGLDRVHIFGVTYLPVLGGLLWLCDRHGLALSTDSSGPVLSVTWKNVKQAGAKHPTWEGNVAWWRAAIAGLRSSPHYREPPARAVSRQQTLFA
jgi:hypothetical protein